MFIAPSAWHHKHKQLCLAHWANTVAYLSGDLVWVFF